MSRHGQGNECYLWPQIPQLEDPFEEDETRTSDGINAMSLYDRAGLQLIVDPLVEDVPGEGSSVDASDTEFTIDFDFTGLEGGTLTVTGAAEPGNNGTFPITTGADGSAVTAGAVGLVDETFGADVTITLTYPLLNGAWSIEISNDYVGASLTGELGQLVDVAPHWTDITDAFDPAIAEVDDGEATSYSQFTQADICVRAIRFSFASTSGYGRPLVIGQLRSFS